MRSISNANTQLFFSWSTDDNTHSIYYRSHKETGDDAQWTPWRQLAFTDDTVARATADANGANIADTYLKKTDKDTLINYNMPNYKRRVDFNKDADFSAPGAGLVVVRMLLSNNKDYTVTVDGVGVVYEKLTDVNNVLQSTFLVKKVR